MTLKITEFTKTPGHRNEKDGPCSGEEFLKKFLNPQFRLCQEKGYILTVDLDGVPGFTTSFLEAAFGGLAREFSTEIVLQGLKIKCEDEPEVITEVNQYIRNANEN